jgi:serine O-acetyltransferase
MKGFLFLREDVQAALDRDPAARGAWEVLLLYSGLHAVWSYRIANWLWRHQLKLIARLLSQITRAFTGIEIHPGASIGRRLFIDHGMGVVIGETTQIGDNVTLYHGVTLGGVNLSKGKRHPTLGNHVVVGAGAKVLGNIFLGDGTRIGANAVVVKSVPANSVVVGVPGQVVVRSTPQKQSPDLDHSKLPDTLGIALTAVLSRLDALEKQQQKLHQQADTNGSKGGHPVSASDLEHSVGIHRPDHGIWHGEDFMI